MKRLAHLGPLAGAALGSLAPFAAAAQLPVAEPVVIINTTSPSTGDISAFPSLSAGEDSGWVALATRLGAQLPTIYGELSDDDPLGPRDLRTSGTYSGVSQGLIYNPTLAGGKVCYMSELNPFSLGKACWSDDDLLVRTGDTLGTTNAIWGDLNFCRALTGGGAIVRGAASFGGGTFVRTYARYPSGDLLLRRGQAVPGENASVQSILSFDASPDGSHWVAVVQLSGGTNTAILLDGDVYRFGMTGKAVTGTPADEALPAPETGTFVDLGNAQVSDAGEVAFYGAVSSNEVVRGGLFRDGRRALNSTAVPLRPDAMDAQGGVATGLSASLGGFLLATYEGQRVVPAFNGLDVDGNGIANTEYRMDDGLSAGVMSGSGVIYGIVRLRLPMNPFFGFAVVKSALKPAASIVCEGAANQTGQPAHVVAVGSTHVGYNRMKLSALGLPTSGFALPLISRTSSAPVQPAGSNGSLCLGGSIGRLPIFFGGAGGTASTDLYLNVLPQGTGTVAAQAGETWYAQLWYRDNQGGVAASNFSDAISISFR